MFPLVSRTPRPQCKAHDPYALVTAPVLSLVEVQTERALHIAVHQLLCGEGNTQDSHHSLVDAAGQVLVPDDVHHGRGTTEGLDNTFDPVDSCIFNAVLGEDGENVSIGVVAGGLLGGAGMDRDPEHNVVVEDSLAIIIRCGEADQQHHRDVNATRLILQQRNDLRSNGLLPQLVLEDWVVC